MADLSVNISDNSVTSVQTNQANLTINGEANLTIDILEYGGGSVVDKTTGANVVVSKTSDELSSLNAAAVALEAAQKAKEVNDDVLEELENKADKDSLPKSLNNLEIEEILV